MGKTQRGVRDGTGPFKGSWRGVHFGLGVRKARGEPCPKKSHKKGGRK